MRARFRAWLPEGPNVPATVRLGLAGCNVRRAACGVHVTLGEDSPHKDVAESQGECGGRYGVMLGSTFGHNVNWLDGELHHNYQYDIPK